MPMLRSLRNRLAIVFGLIVLGAIGTVYLSTVPRLEDRLTRQKLRVLEDDARRSAGALGAALRADRAGEDLAKPVTAAASRAGAEVLVGVPLRGGRPAGLSLAEDSSV